MTVEAIRKMPRSEKLRLMETLWEDLSHPDKQIPSPEWHAKKLAETQRRFAEGREKVLDWEDAKKKLRSKFE